MLFTTSSFSLSRQFVNLTTQLSTPVVIYTTLLATQYYICHNTTPITKLNHKTLNSLPYLPFTHIPHTAARTAPFTKNHHAPPRYAQPKLKPYKPSKKAHHEPSASVPKTTLPKLQNTVNLISIQIIYKPRKRPATARKTGLS